MAGTKLTWDDYIEDLDRDLRRHGLPEEAVEQATAEVRAEVERGERSARPRRQPVDEAVEIRHRRRSRTWRVLTAFPSEAGTLVCVLAGVSAFDRGAWWALVGVVGVFLLEVYGIMRTFRRWADQLFDNRTGAPVSVEAGVRLVLGGIGYVLLLAVVAFQIVH